MDHEASLCALKARRMRSLGSAAGKAAQPQVFSRAQTMRSGRAPQGTAARRFRPWLARLVSAKASFISETPVLLGAALLQSACDFRIREPGAARLRR